MECKPGRLTPIFFRSRNISSDHSAIPIPRSRKAFEHVHDSIEIARLVRSRDISMWFADGSNYPGTANIRHRKLGLRKRSRRRTRIFLRTQRLLVEYKPFEPAFYHTDIADWGMALHWRARRDRRQKCLSIPATIMRRKILNRSWRGCFRKGCWADSILTIVGTRTTI